MKFTQEPNPSAHSLNPEDETEAAESGILSTPEKPPVKAAVKPPVPLIKASDVKAKKAQSAEKEVNPIAEAQKEESRPKAERENQADEEIAAESKPANQAEEPPKIEVSEEKRNEILKDAMNRPEIYEIDREMFKSTDEVSEGIDKSPSRENADNERNAEECFIEQEDEENETKVYTYELDNEEKEPLRTKFKSQSTVKMRRRTVGTVLTIVLIAVLVLGGGTAYANAYNKIYPNISIMGEDVGGLTREEAQSRINGKYGGAPMSSITVECEDARIEIDPASVNAQIQIDETVDYAYSLGRNSGILGRITGIVFKNRPAEDVSFIVSLDEAAVRNMINKLVSPYENYSADRYEIEEDNVRFMKGEKGLRVDRDEAYNKIIGEISGLTFSKVELTPQLAEPERLDADAVYSELTADAAAASYVRENGDVVVKGGKPKVDIEKSAVERAIKGLEDNEVVSVPCSVQAIGPTEKELGEKLFRDTLGSYKTSFSAGNAARSTNVRLAASRINGTILMPGETFSYDKTIGSRTVANGYKEANVYSNNKVDVGVGGGICQTSSTLYSAVLYANLEIVSRTSHSLPVSYIPAGQDATIAEGSIDFKFKNNTDYPVKIVANAASSNVTCTIVGTNIEGISVKLENNITNKAEDGSYSVESYRLVYKDGSVVKREKLKGSHYNAIEPDPTPTPSPTSSSEPAETVESDKPNKPQTEEAVPAPSASVKPSEKSED